MGFFRKEPKLTSTEKDLILKAVADAEKMTTGEIRIHLSHAARESDISKAAEAQFQTLKMHETRDRNGILLYVNPKAKQFSIFGDEGIHQKVGQNFWNDLAASVSIHIREKDMTQGIVKAVLHFGVALKEHFPDETGQKNELSDEISESD